MYCAGRTGRYVSGQAPLGPRRPATCQLRAHDHAGRTGPNHPNPLKAEGVSMATPAPAPAASPHREGGLPREPADQNRLS
jgi:hypothetical protein